MGCQSSPAFADKDKLQKRALDTKKLTVLARRTFLWRFMEAGLPFSV
jgi:hypothetical protein